MRKYLAYVFMSLTVLSCTKESVTTTSTTPEELQPQLSRLSHTSALYKMIHKPERSDVMMQLDNECYPETVDFTGTLTQAQKSFKRGNLLYIIGIGKYLRFSGVGQVSGLIYRGEGGWRDTTILNSDNSGIGWTTIKASWSTSQGNTIIWDTRIFYNFFSDGSGRIVDYMNRDTCR